MEENGLSFFELAMDKSRQHQQLLANNGLDQATLNRLETAGRESLEKQRQIEAADEISFEEFLRQWNDR
jgi:glutamate--cysteine ligase